MFYGNVWKKVIIGRPERWIGIRSDPTFPQRKLARRKDLLPRHDLNAFRGSTAYLGRHPFELRSHSLGNRNLRRRLPEIPLFVNHAHSWFLEGEMQAIGNDSMVFGQCFPPQLVSLQEKGTLPTHFGQLSGAVKSAWIRFRLIGRQSTRDRISSAPIIFSTTYPVSVFRLCPKTCHRFSYPAIGSAASLP